MVLGLCSSTKVNDFLWEAAYGRLKVIVHTYVFGLVVELGEGVESLRGDDGLAGACGVIYTRHMGQKVVVSARGFRWVQGHVHLPDYDFTSASGVDVCVWVYGGGGESYLVSDGVVPVAEPPGV